VTYIVLARLISPTGFGRYAAGGVVTGIGGLYAESGMLSALINRRERIEDSASTAFFALLVSGTLLTLGSLAISPLIGDLFHSSQVEAITAVMSGWLFLHALIIVPSALLQQRFSFVRRVILDPLGSLAFAAAAIPLAATGAGAWALVAGSYASMLLEVPAAWGFARFRPRLRLASFNLWRELARFARPVIVAETLRRGAQQLDTAVLGHFRGAAPLGQYRNGLRLADQPAAAFVSVIAYILYPAFARLATTPERLAAAARHAYWMSLTVAIPMGFAAIPLGVPLAVVLLGPQWRSAGHAIAGLCGIGVGSMIGSIASELFKSVGRPGLLIRLQGVTAVLIAGTVTIGAIEWGLLGVSIAMSVSACGAALYALMTVRALLSISSRQVASWFAGPVAASVVMGAAMLEYAAVVDPLSHAAVQRLALVVGEAVVGAAVYIVALAAIDGPRRREARRLLARLPVPARLSRRPRRAPKMGRVSSISEHPAFFAVPAVACAGVAIGFLAGKSPTDGLAVAIALGFIPLVFARYTVAVGVFLLSTFLDLSSTAQKGLGVLVLVAAVGLLAGSSRAVRKEFFRAQKKLTLLLLVFLAWEFVTVIWATSTGDVFYSLSRWIPNFVLFYVVYAAVDDRKDLMTLLGFFVFAAVISAIIAIASPPPAAAYATVTRDGGLFDPNALAAVLVAGLTVSVAMVCINAWPGLVRIAAGAAAAICMAGILLSVSRGGLIALVVALIVAVCTAGRWRVKLGVATLVVAALGVGYFGFVAPAAVRDRLTQNDGGSGRTTIWQVGWREVKANPIKGVGAGNFSVAGLKYVEEPGATTHEALVDTGYFVDTPTVAHNTYLEVLAEGGIPALLMFLGILGFSLVCIRKAWMACRRSHDTGLELIAYGLFAGLVGFLVASFFLSQEYSKQLYVLLALGPVLLKVTSARVAAAPSPLRIAPSPAAAFRRLAGHAAG
jgi:PST family polysaccharide transporter